MRRDGTEALGILCKSSTPNMNQFVDMIFHLEVQRARKILVTEDTEWQLYTADRKFIAGDSHKRICS